MELYSIAFILILSLILAWCYLRAIPAKTAYYRVLTVPIIFYTINYPLRALILQIGSGNEENNITFGEIILSLTYSFIFMLILFITYSKKSKRIVIKEIVPNKAHTSDAMLCHSTLLIYLAVFLYRLSTGRLFGLYESLDSLYSDFSVNFILMFDNLKWFTVPLSFLLWQTRKKRIYLLEGILATLISLFEAIAAASKGPVVGLMLLYLFISSIFLKKPKKLIIALSLSLIFVYMISTYIIRYHGNVRNEFTFDTFAENAVVLNQQAYSEQSRSMGYASLLNRLNLLDGLIMGIRSYENLDKGIYTFGGLAEVGNLIPRFIWANRPLLNFNIFLTQEVWGYHYLISEAPIGRIGESYLVLGYAGIIYASIYGLLFAYIENYYLKNPHLWKLSFYFLILYLYVWSDAHILFSAKSILWIFGTVTVLNIIWNSVMKRKTTVILLNGAKSAKRNVHSPDAVLHRLNSEDEKN